MINWFTLIKKLMPTYSGAARAREARVRAEPHGYGNVVIYPYQRIW